MNKIFKSYEEEEAYNQEQARIKKEQAEKRKAEKAEERKRRIPINNIIAELYADKKALGITDFNKIEQSVETKKEMLAIDLLKLELGAELMSPEAIEILKKRIKQAYKNINDYVDFIKRYKDNKELFTKLPSEGLTKSIFGDIGEELHAICKDVELNHHDFAKDLFTTIGQKFKKGRADSKAIR